MKTRKAVSLKPKPSGSGSGVETRHEVDVLEVAVVDRLDLLAPCGIVGELVERLHRILVQQAAELVVARHAALTVAKDVHRRQVEVLAIVAREVLQRPRVVVQRHRTRMSTCRTSRTGPTS